MLAGACFTGVSVFTGAAMVGKVWDGFPVRIMLSKIKTTITVPRVQVAFSIKSLVLCTPNVAEEAPPKVPESPPPFGFCAIMMITNKMLAMIIRIINSVNIVLIVLS